MHSAKVAVVLPCYNAEMYLERTLQSVMGQTFQDMQVYAINDGSQDATSDIITSYAQGCDKIHLLQHSHGENRGAPASMNLGVECSDSQYIAFIDADDIWYPDKLASQVKVLDDCQNIGLVYCNGQAIDSNGKHLYMLFDNDHQEKSISENILLNCYIRTPSMVMIRRKILEKSGLFVEKYFYSKDHDLWVKIAELSRLHYIPTCLVGYRIHAQQQSGRRNQWDEGFGVLSDACQRQPRYARIKKKRLAVLYYRIALCEWKHANRLRAVWLLAKAMRNDPNRALWHLVSSSLQGLKG